MVFTKGSFVFWCRIINPFVFQVLAAAFQIASKFGALATHANESSRDD